MLRQLFRCRRSTFGIQISWTGKQIPWRTRDRPLYEGRVLEGRSMSPQREVEALRNDVDQSIRGDLGDLNFGVLL